MTDILASQGHIDVPRALPRKIAADPETVERGLAQLVLTLVELLRQLMERQALRRMAAGTLDDEQVRALGSAFVALHERIDELHEELAVAPGAPQAQR